MPCEPTVPKGMPVAKMAPNSKAELHEEGSDRLDMHKKFTPHHYRHWMTTILHANSCTERVIRYIRGDSDHNIADRYDHLTWTEIHEAYLLRE